MTGEDSESHWDAAYGSGDTGRSWYQSRARISLELISSVSTADVPVIDIGGGASVLVDDLLGWGFADVTILDVSTAGLSIARQRLGSRAEDVEWIAADLSHWQPHREYGVWHDRAVLHFMTEPEQQARYKKALIEATRRKSHAVIGVFGPQGPTQCSGLPVTRFDDESMASFLRPQFDIVCAFKESHETPNGSTQQFLWTVAQRS